MNATNQQLTFARVQAAAALAADSHIARRAHWQAAVFQLALALECYAAELQEGIGIRVPVVPGERLFRQLSIECQNAGKFSSELDELAHLEAEPDSWLTRLNEWRTGLLEVGADRGRASVLAETSLTELEKPGLIEAVQVTGSQSDTRPFDEAQFQAMVRQVREVIERQRQSAAEY